MIQIYLNYGRRYFPRSIQQTLNASRFFTTDGKKTDSPPDNFYDDGLEAEKEFFDIAMSLVHKRGIEGVNTISTNFSWEDLSHFTPNHVAPEIPVVSKSDHNFDTFVTRVKSFKQSTAEGKIDRATLIKNLKEELENDLKAAGNYKNEKHKAHPYLNEESDSEYESFDEGDDIPVVKKEAKRGPFVPGVSSSDNVYTESFATKQTHQREINEMDFRGMLPENDFTGGANDSEDEDDTEKGMLKDTDPDKFGPNEQSQRACPGKLQKIGKRSILQCHKIDLEKLHYADILGLKRFLSEDCEILGRKQTGLCAKCQRKVSRTIKHSRSMGLMPHIGNISITDVAPHRKNKPLHVTISADKNAKKLGPVVTKHVNF